MYLRNTPEIFKYFPNNSLGVPREKYFAMNMITSCQSKFNILIFKSHKFDLKHKILLIRPLLNIETYLNKEHVLRNFPKYFFGAQVNQIVNKYLNV